MALERAGAKYASLSGSGSTLYGLFASKEAARAAVSKLRRQGWAAQATVTLTRRAYWRRILLAWLKRFLVWRRGLMVKVLIVDFGLLIDNEAVG